MFRPVGAAHLSGPFADRYGRRIPMMANLLFYSADRSWPPCSCTESDRRFSFCAALFGIGMGGEWGVGASLVMEKVPPKCMRRAERGFLQEGYAFGYFLAAVAAYYMLEPMGMAVDVFRRRREAPALVAVFVRFFVKESEVWVKKSKAESWSQLGYGLASHWKLWIYLTILMAMMNLSSHGTQDMFPTFLEKFYLTLEPKKLISTRSSWWRWGERFSAASVSDWRRIASAADA